MKEDDGLTSEHRKIAEKVHAELKPVVDRLISSYGKFHTSAALIGVGVALNIELQAIDSDKAPEKACN